MKKIIIVGIDFSNCSFQALEYAIMIAEKTSSNILMVWVGKGKDLPSVYIPQVIDPRHEVKKQFEELIEKHKDRLTNSKLMYKVRNGKVYKEIVNQAKYHDAFLIVTGSHGVSGFEEFWIGSNANKIVTYAPCPVITVAYNKKKKMKLKKIILPIDNTRQTRQKLPFSCYLAKFFDAEIHVVGLYTSKVKTLRSIVDSYVKQVTKHLDELEIKYNKVSLVAENATQTTLEYAKENGGDLIAIMTEQETTTSNILLGPYAQQMVNHSKTPVLSIRTRYIYDYKLET